VGQEAESNCFLMRFIMLDPLKEGKRNLQTILMGGKLFLRCQKGPNFLKRR
jgi:hypothetical protein